MVFKVFYIKFRFELFIFLGPVDGPELGLGPGVSPGTRVEGQEEIEDQSPRIRIKVN